ncbi:very-short-patch mismatch repair endonuclease (g-t specific) [hydrocarbon metagenome]|uniref:Very-short-patch mismatch repair endonuclease (G-t specific) n=1 Tax=hydrocarbon metagenome TaxID=938273 RepID=A0A0W8FG00_9ZZZZ
MIRRLQRTGEVFSDMVDCYPKETRSRVMSKIRSKQTRPEILLRKCLWRRGWRGYRINIKDLPGKPDIVFRSQKVAIFIDGCFWHKCPMCFVEPKSNREYWLPKIEKNVARDQVANEQLQKMGWKVIRIWEHEVKEDVEKCAEKIIKQICSKNE